MELYKSTPYHLRAVSMLQAEIKTITVAVIDLAERLTCVVEQLAEQVKILQLEALRMRRLLADISGDCQGRDGESGQTIERQKPRQQATRPRVVDGECWRCHQHGHIACCCTQSHRSQQGN